MVHHRIFLIYRTWDMGHFMSYTMVYPRLQTDPNGDLYNHQNMTRLGIIPSMSTIHDFPAHQQQHQKHKIKQWDQWDCLFFAENFQRPVQPGKSLVAKHGGRTCFGDGEGSGPPTANGMCKRIYKMTLELNQRHTILEFLWYFVSTIIGIRGQYASD